MRTFYLMLRMSVITFVVSLFCISAGYAQTYISTADEMLTIANDTAGWYILSNDIDMDGVEWSAPDFTGTLDGNGYSILNLEVDLDDYAGLFKIVKTP